MVRPHNDSPHPPPQAHIHIHAQVLSLMLEVELPWGSPASPPWAGPLGLLLWEERPDVRKGATWDGRRGALVSEHRAQPEKELTWPWGMSYRDERLGRAFSLP